MGERSVERNGSRRSLKRLARRQVAALSLAGLVLLLATAGALAVTGDLTQPAGTAGCISETGAGPCADGHGLDGPFGVAVSPDGKSVYVASTAATPWRASTATRPPGRSPSPPGPPAASARRGRGPAPTAMGSSARARWRSAPTGRASTSPRLQRRRGAPQPQHDHRGDHPARRDRRLRQRDGGGALRRRPWARRPVRGGGQPGREERLRRLAPAATPWRASTATRPPGRSPSPPGRAGCVSETGSGPCADGHGLDGPASVAVSPDGKSVYVASLSTATPWRASTATRPPGRSPSPPGPPAASARRGRGPAPTAMGSAARTRWR